MKPFLMLRALVYLKRISKALDRIAEAQERSIPVDMTRRPKLDQVFVPTTDEMNDLWSEEHGET